MNSLLESLNFSICGAALLLSVMGLWITAAVSEIDRFNKRFFIIYFLVFILCCLSGIIEIIFQHYFVPDMIFNFLLRLEAFLLSLPLLMLTVYLLHCCGENIRKNTLLRTNLVLWIILFIVIAGSGFIEGFLYVTPENRYYRGSLYPLVMLPAIAIMLLNLAGTIKRRKRISRKVFQSFLVAILPITAALIVHLFIDIYSLVNISYAISALVMFFFVLSDQIDKDRLHQQEIIDQKQKIAEQQREIAHERSSVMVLQMRPHFIYNTLMSIHSLCSLDPLKAQQITMDFTNYLRRNFNAVASDSTVPFSTEMEHTRAYLAVEQALFDDMLVVDYDTPFTCFRLPPLTLQPIVENAVKHGMNPYSGPLRISIRTRHTESCVWITVEDTGPGFALSDESKPHIALKNIQKRLEMMCEGTMTITPRDGGGTVVKITIPECHLSVKNESS